ncbi:MAG: hypothetical protein WAQ28_20825 [Bacteroidia bacterium]|jgi:hypothetical protein
MKTIAQKHYFPVVILLLSLQANAQRSIIPKDSLPNGLYKRNEISINISPLKSLFLPSSLPQTNYAVTYKRFLDKKTAIRAGIGLDIINSNFSYQYMPYNSIQHKSYKVNSSSPFIRMGLEKHFGGKKLTFFYGVDLMIGYYRGNTSIKTTDLSRDSTGSVHLMRTKQSMSENVLQFGVSPFIGAKYNFSKNFALSFQTGYNFIYQAGQRTITNSAGTRTYRVNSVNWNRGPGFFSDISLIYKF